MGTSKLRLILSGITTDCATLMFMHYSFYSRIYHSKPESVHKSKPRNVSFENAERIAKREDFAHIRMHAKLEWFYRPFFFSLCRVFSDYWRKSAI